MKMKVRITFTEPVLGTASADPEIHEKFIASKSADKAKVKEEIAALSAEELIEKSLTVFPRDEDGNPFLWDYQIKGFLKEALGTQVEFGPIELSKKPAVKLSKYTFKRVVDNFIFVFPRRAVFGLPDGGEVTTCTRPLRADTMKGERVALATSEEIPAGSTVECEIVVRHPKLESLIVECLDYGALKGIGQWRNSGKGRFTYEVIE